MDLKVEGSRPPSARPQSRINPITGEEMPYSARTPRQQDIVPESRPQSRPDGVPSLNLGPLAAGGLPDREPRRPIEMDPYKYKLDSPGASSAVSWGTSYSALDRLKEKQASHISAKAVGVPSLQLEEDQPKKAQSHLNGGQKQAANYNQKPVSNRQKTQSAWDKQPVPEDLPPPSHRYVNQYKQYAEEMKESYRQTTGRTLTEEEIDAHIEKLRLDIPQYQPCVEEDEAPHTLQKTWTANPYSREHLRKKADVEDLEAEKKKFKLLETVMIDQLSRPVMSDPEQNRPQSGRAPPTSHQPGMKRGAVRTLHSTRVKTSGSATENLLSRRVRFGARILTRSGRDAIRELTGFYFAADNSLTIYEFKQFGKSAKALPFIKRGVYVHLSGKRKGESYILRDIIQGGTLAFETANQPIPDTLVGTKVILFKITDVDDEAKAGIILDGVSPFERDDIWKRAHLPPTKDEIQAKLLMKDVQALVRRQIQKRGIKVMTGLGKLFRKLDENHDGVLNMYELEKALLDFHIELPQEAYPKSRVIIQAPNVPIAFQVQKFEDLWEVLDTSGSSFLDYSVFSRGFLGDMSEDRKALVRKAFWKIDSSKQGVVSLHDMRKFYNAYRHPKVKSGECSEEAVLQSFLAAFEDCETRGQITFAEFEEYYEGLSICIENDEDFANILKNAWGI